jgi:hypothetical protein
MREEALISLKDRMNLPVASFPFEAARANFSCSRWQSRSQARSVTSWAGFLERIGFLETVFGLRLEMIVASSSESAAVAFFCRTLRFFLAGSRSLVACSAAVEAVAVVDSSTRSTLLSERLRLLEVAPVSWPPEATSLTLLA